MLSKNGITFLLLAALLFSVMGCGTTSTIKRSIITRGEAFPQMYEEQPRSIAILPPLNTSTLPEAGNYYMATITTPLNAAGYQVTPEETVKNVIDQNTLHDNSLYSLPPQTLGQYFGSDAALFARIKQWDVAHTALLSRLIISIEAELISTKTSKQLWRYNTSINIDLNAVKSTAGAGLSLLAGMKKEDVDKATADALSHALQLNTKLIRDLPFGPGHEDYLQDQKMELIGSIPGKSILKQPQDIK
ncbi:hypothetical protein UWK_00543 [Desulfocapsa sulfexigens DSM 10523]|uniref:Lipoprotein n=1 Tax=Desulfocapsa sulfexigens (strain DSM 10523 / SB164P1) TaxID=1167006 RepID=M1NBE4_DESSD|nr:GNA1162 family protein [Desulfocapsa sulfexigens]AGF77124.1 hypothetical protein UWK_00543 [Desulfocapsa sulfexigens DSM 10523]